MATAIELPLPNLAGSFFSVRHLWSVPWRLTRCPKSIVAACIYIAFSSTENDISYATLVAVTGVNIASYYTTHTMMAFDLLYDKISVQAIAD